MNFKLQVLSPSRPVANVAATGLMVPGVEGYFEVLPGHAPLIAELAIGELIIRKSQGEPMRYFLAGGFLEVTENSVTVLADVIETPNELDLERAKKAQERAEKRLIEKNERLDVGRAIDALKRARVREAIASQEQKSS